MGLATQRTLIEAELITELRLLRPDFVLIGENADESSPSNEPWCRMSITTLDITHPCVGNSGRIQYECIFNAQIFTPLGIGAGDASLIADQVRTILKGSTLTGIEFLTFDVSTGVKESGWYSLLMRAYYRARD